MTQKTFIDPVINNPQLLQNIQGKLKTQKMCNKAIEKNIIGTKFVSDDIALGIVFIVIWFQVKIKVT